MELFLTAEALSRVAIEGPVKAALLLYEETLWLLAAVWQGAEEYCDQICTRRE